MRFRGSDGMLLAAMMLAAGAAQGQEAALSARELFYVPKATPQQPAASAGGGATTTPPVKKTATPATAPPKKKVTIAVGEVQVTGPGKAAPAVVAAKADKAVVATRSVVQVDEAVPDCRKRGVARPPAHWVNVAESTVFKPGQRVRLVMQANVAGFVYIFARQSSGGFEDLYPTLRDTAEQTWQPVEAYEDAALPAFCITEQKGEQAENEIWVLVTQDPRRAMQFRESIRSAGKGGAAPPERSTGTVYAMNVVEDALKRAGGDLASRDVVRDEDSGLPKVQGRPAHAVYRKTSGGSGDQVFSIKLKQE